MKIFNLRFTLFLSVNIVISAIVSILCNYGFLTNITLKSSFAISGITIMLIAIIYCTFYRRSMVFDDDIKSFYRKHLVNIGKIGIVAILVGVIDMFVDLEPFFTYLFLPFKAMFYIGLRYGITFINKPVSAFIITLFYMMIVLIYPLLHKIIESFY